MITAFALLKVFPVSNRSGRFLKRGLFLSPLLLSSCSRAPSFDILGSYFPAWLICLALSVLLAAVIRWLLLRLQIEVVFPIVVYPSLTALFAFGMWLVFYG
jgi:YtcA-like protein